MKKLNIKTKFSLYIALVMAAFALVLMLFTVTIARTSAENSLKMDLREEVDLLLERIGYEEIRLDTMPPEGIPNNKFKDESGMPEDLSGMEGMMPPEGEGRFPDKRPFDYVLKVPEDISYVSDGVSFYIYAPATSRDEEFVGGSLPEGVYFDEHCKENKIVKTDKHYTFTRFIEMPNSAEGGVWIVGTISTYMSSTIAFDATKYALLIIPVVIVLAAQYGYSIMKRAFKPVAAITETASGIAKGDDLSLRLNMGDGKDEIGRLASTFDDMLDTIGANFNRQKQFTADASHELRTPVAVIMAQSELALDPKATKEDVVSAIESINRQSHKINKLLSELLTLARSDNKKAVLEKEEFDLRELADIIVEEQTLYAEERGITLKTENGDAVSVFADRTQIMRVLINLINNAIKYGKNGGKVTVSVERDTEGHALCKVADDGIGIAPEDMDKIWNRFYRCDSARTADAEGSMGLGLSMVKSIVEGHGGKVTAESVPNEGSVFGFTL